MYIIVNNKYVVYVFRIKRIGNIGIVGEDFYNGVLSAYAQFLKTSIKKYEDKEITYGMLAEDYTATPVNCYRYYHTFLSTVQKALVACGVRSGIFTDSSCSSIKNGSLIPWKIFPDMYLFCLECDDKRFNAGEYTTTSQIFSKFYNTESEAEEARDSLVSLINSVRMDAPKIKI